MKTLIRIEEFFLFILAVFLFSRLNYDWRWFPLLLLAPDVGMVGYLWNTGIGAVVYNIIHHRAVAITLYITGAAGGVMLLQLIGIILFAHATLDRIFGYGLKYGDRFNHTHLSGGSAEKR